MQNAFLPQTWFTHDINQIGRITVESLPDLPASNGIVATRWIISSLSDSCRDTASRVTM